MLRHRRGCECGEPSDFGVVVEVLGEANGGAATIPCDVPALGNQDDGSPPRALTLFGQSEFVKYPWGYIVTVWRL